MPRHDELSDDALVAGMAVLDGEAAAAFVRRFQRRVYGLALHMVGDRSLAEDVAQTAFLRAWRAASTYDVRRGTVVSWVLTIARNASIDAIRARRIQPVDAVRLHEMVESVAARRHRVGRQHRRYRCVAGGRHSGAGSRAPAAGCPGPRGGPGGHRRMYR
ncbi:MAG: sigma-70 family RNA polymerase sigma factor [Ilumatobacteraceae bacterium]